MNILSLFDGMACGMLAMLKAGTQVDNYYAYEIDKYAVQAALHNFTDIQEFGDVFNADFTKHKDIDYLIGGSPCTYWSIAQSPDKRETTASGIGWELFSQYVRALHEAKPKYFIYENNKSMSKAIYESISETFGFEPIMINSALVSAQNRQRYYWVGKSNTLSTVQKDNPICVPVRCFTLPREDGVQTQSKQYRVYDVDGKSTTLCAEGGGMGAKTGLYAVSIKVGEVGNGGQGNRIYTVDGKSVTQQANSGGFGSHTGLYAIPVEFNDDKPIKAISGVDGKTYTVYEVKNGNITIKGKTYPIKLIDGYYIIRKLTVSECKRLQTVPEWYQFPVSDTRAYKMLGNGWIVDVIAHLIEATKTGKTVEKIEQLSLF